jgi:AcrR family transcriptional regulator
VDAAEGTEVPSQHGRPGPGETGFSDALSHNRYGQRLGRKGRDTRERILAAAHELLCDPDGAPISLSAVARRASLGMTSLYLYFNDLTEVLLALLEPLTAEAEDAFLGHLRARWPDATLGADCAAFVTAFHSHWEKNARILHFRNSLSDQRDQRMMQHRVRSAQPIIGFIIAQMDHDPAASRTSAGAMATVLYTGIERIVAMVTDPTLPLVLERRYAPSAANLILAEARLLELAIREGRATATA